MRPSSLPRHAARVVALLAFAIILGACRHQEPETEPSTGEEVEEERQESYGAGRPVARAEELMAGRFSGVQVIQMPNGEIAVRVRGRSSFLGSGDPLFVVDGTPMDPGPGGALLGINPADIVDIQVLRDISSLAEYGVRGANGVILITTRRP
ncbi:TonB-dependent receptor plug domain-containing protein [Longimicrobium terrae]|uniref:TonB-dependent SusC/RagA subfamily outer membrane receptor n=1 Tax=Longimicrobium terrae TaxID=1639882 RepID=A0A841GV09_9BACT|nr:TonB-dependent receptor plug domain-containing protein [Longimicrobium terrae]MBB4634006.1 TonB-dependent SusC/RagA subfamily outer membrane receptor [Longimicrobium terrae]MBB6069104.1 TonB-dependent SusC/RagA subfamily outer membrane receptor [Longimicrobium terrae]NNC28278.1 TonB-dependent receptor plug domain-containing protein [Longimicrobium terrae]